MPNIQIKKNKSASSMPEMVQVLNPRTNRYTKVNRTKGLIVSYKKSEGPYKDIPIYSRKTSEIYEAACNDSETQTNQKRSTSSKPDMIQVCDPRTGRYAKVNQTLGLILSYKKSEGPYKNVPIHRSKYNKKYTKACK